MCGDAAARSSHGAGCRRPSPDNLLFAARFFLCTFIISVAPAASTGAVLAAALTFLKERDPRPL